MSNDGGPAFPAQPVYKAPSGAMISHQQGGMSLRDYLAGQSIDAACKTTCVYMSTGDGAFQHHVAVHAYKLADALLSAREEKPHE